MDRSKSGSFFLWYEWLKVIEESLGLTPFHLVVRKEANIIGGIPNFAEPIKKLPLQWLISLPQGQGGFLITTDKRSTLQALLSEIDRICKEHGFVAHRIITSDLQHAQYANYLKKLGYSLHIGGCRFIIDLRRSYPEIESSFSSARRYDVRKLRSDIEVEDMVISEGTLKLFYNIYRKTMQRVEGSALPFDFFQKMLQHVGDQIKLFMAKVGGEYMAGFLYCLDQNKLIIHHYLGASRGEYQSFKPNIALHVHTIKWGIQAGYHFYDMGGSSFFDDGTFKFKAQWGGDIRPNLIWERDIATPKGLLYRFGRKMYERFALR